MRKLIVLLILCINFSYAGWFTSTSLKCYVLTAPEKTFPGVKKIAIMNFDYNGEYYNPDQVIRDYRNSKKVDRPKDAVGLIFELSKQAAKKDQKETPTDDVEKQMLDNLQKEKESNNKEFSKTIVDGISGKLLEEKRGISDFVGFFTTTEGKTYIKGINTNFYTIVERGQIDKVLNEQGFSASGVVDESKASSLGNLLGVDALIIGSASHTFNDATSTENLKTKDGRPYTNFYANRTVTVEITMKIVSVESGQVLGSKVIRKSATDSKVANDKYPTDKLMKVKEMAKSLIGGTYSELVNYFAPYFSAQKFVFKDVKNKQFKKQIEEQEDIIENGDINKPFPVYKALYEADSYSPVACYDLGIFYEVVGDYENAKKVYGEAYDLDPKEDLYVQATKRVDKAIEMTAALKKIGVNIDKYEFVDNSGGNALAEKIELRGGSGDRISAYSEPDKNSQEVAKLPGGLKFDVIEKKGDWYYIKLKGDKKGFIHKSDLD